MRILPEGFTVKLPVVWNPFARRQLDGDESRALYWVRKRDRKRRRFLGLSWLDCGAVATTSRIVRGKWRVLMTWRAWPCVEPITRY